MKDFIDEYINTISARRRERIYDIISDSELHKKDVEALSDKLNEFRRQAPLIIKGEVPGNQVSSGKFDITFRDIQLRLFELYKLSNDISSLLFNNTATLTAEIKALDDELVSMEKAIDNYAFSLSDSGSYDYSFIETFSDEVMSETQDLQITDRNNIPFEKNNRASVNTASGILTLSPGVSTAYGLTGSIVESNCLGYATSDTGIEKALNDNFGEGWRIAISSPRPIVSSLRSELASGAQMYLEFFLQNPSPSDTVILTPFSDTPVDVLSIRVFDNLTDNTYNEVLTSSVSLDRPISFNFSLKSISKIGIVINQPIYKRKTLVAQPFETQYRALSNSLQDQRKRYEEIKNKPYKRNKKVQKYVLLKSQKNLHDFPGFFNSVSPNIDFDKLNGPVTLDNMLFKRNKPNGNELLWKNQNFSQDIIKKMIFDKVFAGNLSILPKRTIIDKRDLISYRQTSGLNKTLSSYDGQGSLELIGSENAPNVFSTSDNNLSQSLDYQYDLGLRTIKVGVGSSVYSGYYLSKVLPAPGDSGEVRLQVNDTNFQLANSIRDSSVVTSVEYSITNRSVPNKESDWIPILPSNQEIAIAERFFVDQSGVGYFRFPASSQKGITIYRNGFRMDLGNENSFIYDAAKISVLGVRIPIRNVQITDVLTCDYTPSGDPYVVNFEDMGFGQSNLASAHDAHGAGETFTGTSNDRVVSLSYNPYIDYEQVIENGQYGSSGFTGTYQPIVVQLADGTVAINQTNYSGFVQNSLADLIDSSTIYYIHSGKNLIFNKAFDQSFTVYYQYLPSNLRFRVVMRVNDPLFITPIVDSVQVKAKLRKADKRKVL